MTGLFALSPCLSKEQARLLSPLQLAYVGDSVHALLVRTQLIKRNLPVKKMHLASNQAVSAVSQAKSLSVLSSRLTEEELDIVKRGRNAHPHHGAPKSATSGEYAGATGLEAFLGYLYLTGNIERILELAPFFYSED